MAADTANAASTWGATSPDVIPRELKEPIQHRDLVAPAAKLDFHSIRWGITVNTGNFSSARLDAEAYVPHYGDPLATLEHLKEWVSHQAPAPEWQRLETDHSVQRLADEEQAWLRKVAAAKDEWDRVKKVLDRLGVDLEREEIADLPF